MHNVFPYVGQIFSDGVPLDSNLVQLFGSTVKARWILVFLLCVVLRSPLLHFYARVRGQTYNSQQRCPLIFNRITIGFEKSICNHRVQEERLAYLRPIFLRNLDYACLQVGWEVDTEVGKPLGVCNELCECVGGVVSPEPESILQCYIVSHLIMRMNKKVKQRDDVPIEDRLEAVEDTVGNTVQSGLS